MPLDIWLVFAIWTSSILGLVLAIYRPHKVAAFYGTALFGVAALAVLISLR